MVRVPPKAAKVPKTLAVFGMMGLVLAVLGNWVPPKTANHQKKTVKIEVLAVLAQT